MKEKKYLKEYNVLIKFLERTKDGSYAPIEETSIPYARMDVEDYTVDNYGEYYFSLS